MARRPDQRTTTEVVSTRVPETARTTYTPETATEQVGRIAALEAALVEQRRETGEAQQATRARDVEEARLRAFVSDSEEMARVVLADRPQQREWLGLLER